MIHLIHWNEQILLTKTGPVGFQCEEETCLEEAEWRSDFLDGKSHHFCFWHRIPR